MKGEKTMTINMNEVITGVTLTKVCSIRADEDSSEKKNITLRVKFDGATLKGVFDKALSSAVISWQNGVGRKAFDKFKSGQTVDIQFVAPASSAIDPESAMIAKLSTMTAEEQTAYFMEMMKKAKPVETVEKTTDDKVENE